MARYTKQDQFTIGGQNDENEKIATAINDTLSRKGDSPNAMEANIDMNGNRIVNLPIPSDSQEAASKAYVDSRSAISLSDESLFKRPTDFGAAGDGVTDDTDALVSALSSGLPILIDQTYNFKENLTISSYVDCVGAGKFLYTGTEGSASDKPLTIDAGVVGNIVLDCSNKSVRGISLKAPSEGQKIESIRVMNIETKNAGFYITAGVYTENAGDYIIGSVKLNDLTNSSPGTTNVSTPQGFVSNVSGSNVYIGKMVSDNCRSVLVTVDGTNTQVDDIGITNCEDNGVYCLGGNVVFGQMTFTAGNTLQEPIVNRGRLYGGKLIVKGATLTCVNVDNAEYTNIQEVLALPLDSVDKTNLATYRSNIPQSLWYQRTGNTASGPTVIGKFLGDVSLFLFRAGFSSGSSEYLYIGEMDVSLYYDPNASNFSYTNFFNLSNVEKLNINPSKVKIFDVTSAITAGDSFDAQWSPSEFSTIENLDVSFYNSDGTPATVGSSGIIFRGDAQSDKLVISGGYWQTNTSTVYLREQQAGGSRRNYFQNNELPSSGYWWKNQTFLVNDSTNVQFIRCDVSGDASTGGASFVRSGGVASTDVTANRTLSFDDSNRELVYTGATGLTTTIDTNANQPIDTKSKISLLVTGTAQQTFTAVAGVTINGVDGGSFTLDQYQNAVLTKVGTNAWVVNGDNSSVA